MARRLIDAARRSGDTSIPGVDSVAHNIYRWERGDNGLSDRYKLHYCRAFGISPEDFGAGQAEHPACRVSVSGAGALAKEIVGLLDDLRDIFREWRETLPASRAKPSPTNPRPVLRWIRHWPGLTEGPGPLREEA
jgi:hypothetical protein